MGSWLATWSSWTCSWIGGRLIPQIRGRINRGCNANRGPSLHGLLEWDTQVPDSVLETLDDV